MSNGPASEQKPASEQGAEPLPRRGGAGAPAGRIPTQYGPGNPIRKPDAAGSAGAAAGKQSGFRITPGAPDRPEPQPQRPTEPEGEIVNVFAVRPGAPEDSPPGAPGPAPTVSATHADFVAMAERGEAARRRKRRFRLATALVVIGGLAAVGGTLLATGSRSGKAQHTAAPQVRASATAPTSAAAAAPTPAPTTAAPPSPAASAPASLLAVLSAANSDSAPLTAAALFPARATGPGGQVYSLAATTASACASAVTAPLAAVLAKNGCEQLFRASYSSGGTAVTVGIAVFAGAGPAAAVKSEATGNLVSLPGGPLHPFCRGVVCRLSVNSVGRYAYFTVAGYTDGKPVPATDTLALTAGADMERLVIQSLQARARAEAAHAGASAG